VHQALRHHTHDHRVRLGYSLHAGGNVGRFTQRQHLALVTAADLANHDWPSVNADTYLKRIR
jgi:hypothetical protein